MQRGPCDLLLCKVANVLVGKRLEVVAQVPLAELGVGVVDCLAPRPLDAVGSLDLRVEEPALQLVRLVNCFLQRLRNRSLTLFHYMNPQFNHVIRVHGGLRHHILEPRLGVVQQVPQQLQLTGVRHHLQVTLRILGVASLLRRQVEVDVANVVHGCVYNRIVIYK